MFNQSIKFHEDVISSFWVILLTETNIHGRKHNVIGGGNDRSVLQEGAYVACWRYPTVTWWMRYDGHGLTRTRHRDTAEVSPAQPVIDACSLLTAVFWAEPDSTTYVHHSSESWDHPPRRIFAANSTRPQAARTHTSPTQRDLGTHRDGRIAYRAWIFNSSAVVPPQYQPLHHWRFCSCL